MVPIGAEKMASHQKSQGQAQLRVGQQKSGTLK